MVKESNLNPQTEALINTFCEITSSSSKSQALFFLESHNFDLDSAVSTFLENTSLPSASVAATAAADPVSPSDSQSYSPSHSDSSSPSGSRSPSPLPSISSKRKRKPSNAYNLRSSRPRNAAAGKVAVADAAVAVGRRSLNRQSTTGSGSDSDEPQEYSIRKSECPKEHEPADRKTSVRVNLAMSEEDCPVPEKRHASSQGVGRTLGNTSNAVAVESTVAVSSFTAAPAPSVGLVVDQTQPSTSIQVRLADGTRMVSRFNFQHSIRDIRGFIDASRPGGPRSYQLQTVGFPPKELADLNQTIEQADLANSVVIQKL